MVASTVPALTVWPTTTFTDVTFPDEGKVTEALSAAATVPDPLRVWVTAPVVALAVTHLSAAVARRCWITTSDTPRATTTTRPMITRARRLTPAAANAQPSIVHEPLLALDSRIDVAVTAPLLFLLPCAAAQRPALSADEVVDSVVATVVLPVSVTVTGVVVALAEDPALGAEPPPWPPWGLVAATVTVLPDTAVTLPVTIRPMEPPPAAPES